MFAFSLQGRAEEAPSAPDVRADAQKTMLDTGDTLLTGHAVLIWKGMTLNADSILYSARDGSAVAKGNVVMDAGQRRMLADEITYYFKSDTFKVIKPRLGEFPLYLKGSLAEGTRERIVFHDAQASYTEPGPWTPSMAAKSMTYEPARGTVSAEFARFGVGPVHPIAVPRFNHTLGFSLRSMLTLKAGYRGQLGVFVQPGLRVPLATGLRVGADLGMYSRRGFMAGPGADYDMKFGEDGEMRGQLHSGYINDHGNRYRDVLDRTVPEDRGFVSWEHHQKLTANLTLDGNLGYWSDSEVVRDFRPHEFFPVQVPDTYLESVYSGENYQVSLFGRFQPNDYHVVQERLPELRLDVFPVPLFGGVYQRLMSSVARLREDSPTAPSVITSDRGDAYYALTRNFSTKEWLNATAIVGGRLTRYERLNSGSGRDNYTRALGEFGFDASLQTAGVFNYKNERWKIDGLRHLLTPKLSYRYIPEAEKGRRYIPAIDTESFNTYLPQLGLGDIRHIDDLHEANVLRASVENTLQTRDDKYGSRDLATLVLANDFRFSREAGQRKVSETHVGLGLTPVNWMRFDLYQSFRPQSMELRELNTGFTIKDADQWTLRLSTHYLRHDIAEYIGEYSYRLNEVYTAFMRLHYDARRSRMNEQTYGIQQLLGRSWVIRYETTLFQGPRREGDFEFHVEVRAIGF